MDCRLSCELIVQAYAEQAPSSSARARLYLAIPGGWRRKAAGVVLPADLTGADGQRVSLWGNDPRVTISSKIHFTTATEGLTV